MVDPLPLDDTACVKALESYYSQQAVMSDASNLFKDYVEHHAHWSQDLFQ